MARDWSNAISSRLPNKIIKIVQKNIDDLLQKPKHLAWCLMCYGICHLACRKSGYETNNLKDAFLDDPEKDWPLLSVKQRNLLYEAFVLSSSYYIPEDFPNSEIHEDMTLDDWVKIIEDPNYYYKSLFRDRDSIIKSLFFTSNYEWNERGFLHAGRKGVDNLLFWGYTQVEKEVDPKIRDAILAVGKHKNIEKSFQSMYSFYTEFHALPPALKKETKSRIFGFMGEQKSDDFFLDLVRKAPTGEFPKSRLDELTEQAQALLKSLGKDEAISEETEDKPNVFLFNRFWRNQTNLESMPNNAHPSYVREALNICRIIAEGRGIINGRLEGSHKPVTQEMQDIATDVLKRWETLGYKA